MEWGKPAIVDHKELDNLIINGPSALTKDDTDAINILHKFAANAREIETPDKASSYARLCVATGAVLSDIFYVIDNTNLSWANKFLLKLYTNCIYIFQHKK